VFIRPAVQALGDSVEIDYNDLFFSNVDLGEFNDSEGILQQIGDFSKLSTFSML
jgi:hypothetical protein